MDRLSEKQLDEFQHEHDKRERHMTAEQRRASAVGLLQRLPDSIAYQASNTPEARRAEERELNRYLQVYLQNGNPKPE